MPRHQIQNECILYIFLFRYSDDPRPGIPESITLTVLETNPTDIGNLHSYSSDCNKSMDLLVMKVVPFHKTTADLTVRSHKYHNAFSMSVSELHFFGALFHTVFQPDEATTATEDWVSTSRWLLIRQTEVVTGGETTEFPLDLTPALLEDTTQPTTGEPCSVLQIQMCFFVFFSVLSCVFCISVCCCSCDVKLVKSLSSFALVMLIAFQSHSEWKPLKRR